MLQTAFEIDCIVYLFPGNRAVGRFVDGAPSAENYALRSGMPRQTEGPTSAPQYFNHRRYLIVNPILYALGIRKNILT